MRDIEIRAFEAGDRDAVRRICFVTGYMGDPVDWLWRDAESFADLFTSYYTDGEPGSAYVAVLDGQVVGYLLGCLDTKLAAPPAKVVTRNFLRRGVMLRPGTAGVIWRSAFDLARDALHGHKPPSPVIDARWPAHLHIDLLEVARGQGVGGRLIRTWLDRLRAEGVAGCHLETWGENASAIAFFEAMGFAREGDAAPMPGMRSPQGDRHTIQLMVQPLG